jgi:hypothetical protein
MCCINPLLARCLLSLQILGPHPDYVSPVPPAPVAHMSMPPPAARPRTSSYSGAAGGGGSSKQKQRKPPTVRTGGPGGGGGGGGGSGGGTGAARLGAPPYNAAGLEARLAVADLPDLANMLSAISRKERRWAEGCSSLHLLLLLALLCCSYL